MRSALHFYCLIRADTFWIFSGFLRRYLRLCCLRIVIVLVLTSSDVWSKTYQFSFIFIPDIILMALCLSVHQVTLFLSPRFQNHSTCSPCTEQSSHDGEQTQSVFVFVFFLLCYDTRINDLHEVCTVSGHLNHFKTELTLLLLMMLQTETRLIFISKHI